MLGGLPNSLFCINAQAQAGVLRTLGYALVCRFWCCASRKQDCRCFDLLRLRPTRVLISCCFDSVLSSSTWSTFGDILLPSLSNGVIISRCFEIAASGSTSATFGDILSPSLSDDTPSAQHWEALAMSIEPLQERIPLLELQASTIVAHGPQSQTACDKQDAKLESMFKRYCNSVESTLSDQPQILRDVHEQISRERRRLVREDVFRFLCDYHNMPR